MNYQQILHDSTAKLAALRLEAATVRELQTNRFQRPNLLWQWWHTRNIGTKAASAELRTEVSR